MAEYLEIPVEKVLGLLNKSGTNISIDEPFRQDGEHTLLDVLRTNGSNPDDKVMYESIRKEIQYSMKILNKRDRDILILFFGLGGLPKLSLEDIGKKFNITKEHVSRLKERALNQLRHCSNAPVLKSCLS